MTRLLQLAVPCIAAVLVAGCGGGGGGSAPAGSGEAESSSGGSGNVQTTSGAYDGAFQTCSAGTVEEVADLYGVPQQTPDAVAEVVAEQLAGGSGDHAGAKQGCLDAFAQQS